VSATPAIKYLSDSLHRDLAVFYKGYIPEANAEPRFYKYHFIWYFCFMEFLAGPNGPIVPDPEAAVTDKHLASTESAMDLFRSSAERVMHFKQRVSELGRSGQDTVITVLNVDDPIGGVLADILMPDHDWQRYRDAGEVPVARGLASKSGISEFLEEAGYQIAADELAGTYNGRPKLHTPIRPLLPV
jgi:hypothetical protein